MFTYTRLTKVFLVFLFLILLLSFRPLLKIEMFKNTKSNKSYNQKDWSLVPPESWKLPQPKLPVCTNPTIKKSSSVATSGYPYDNMLWQKSLEIVDDPYEKDTNQYAPGIYVMDKNPEYPNFKGGI